MKQFHWFFRSLTNSYSQIFFSNNVIFAIIIFLITFYDLYAGLFGLLSVLFTNLSASLIGFDRYKIKQGYYGFNALLVGLGLGIYFEPGIQLLVIIVLAAFLSLFLSVAFEGIIGKYALPYLSLPFVFTLWAISLSTREFTFLNLNERGVYYINDLYQLGGQKLVDAYYWWNNLPFPISLKIYFNSLSSIFFQYSTLTGILIAIGLLINSRIAFTLSLLGFYTAYFFYAVIGVEFSGAAYSFIGFNYILTAIAIGGYFIVPGRISHLWVLLLIPITTIITISTSVLLNVLYLPVYSLPFNIITLLFLYILKFRVHKNMKIQTVVVQEHSPEKNLYSHLNFMKRFGKDSPIPVSLPFYGEWFVSQGCYGSHTHRGDWEHAWDFEIKDDEGRTFRGSGDFVEDYYCYGKNILAPADGTVEEVFDGVADNIVGEKNLKQNWGNTVIIKHSEFLFSQLSHLKKSTVCVAPGQKIKKGDIIGKCGNSGHSPYPHVHFQLQSTPFLGSKTIEYPFSNYFLKTDGKYKLQKVHTPAEGDIVSNILTQPLIKNALCLVPGETFEFKSENNEEVILWEVKIDYFLNKYIECTNTGSRAWFRTEDSMLYFLHFEGNRKSLLYHFYLAAFTVCFGNPGGLKITDTYPLNMVYNPWPLVWQDFLAPFFRFYQCGYRLHYPESNDRLSESEIVLASETNTFTLGRLHKKYSHSLHISSTGISGIGFDNGTVKKYAVCIRK
ncbi:MAG TPA: urea transporter [Bacteroidales bacterium]|nr:urea transporter [Bacteroidales bacterium]